MERKGSQMLAFLPIKHCTLRLLSTESDKHSFSDPNNIKYFPDFRTLSKMTDLSIVDDEDASYLDIDDILMTEDKIGCKAKYDLLQVDFRRTQEGRCRKNILFLKIILNNFL